MDVSFSFLLTALAVICIVYKLLKARGGADPSAPTSPLPLPPSLPSLPILGSLPFLSGIENLHFCFEKKAKSYGNVFSFRAGSK